jgi:multidrug transporter EmrE-like cation transporter
MKWLILLLGIASNASASALIKEAMSPLRKMPSLSEPLVLFTNWPLFLGLALYGSAFVLYAVALSKFPLSFAHPALTAGSIALVALLSVIFFGEKLNALNMLGLLAIITGVILLTIK